MPPWRMRFALMLLGALGVISVLRADRAADLARIHLEVMGGRSRVTALEAMRVTGNVVASGKQVRFVMTAARPNRLRLETERGGRTLVQGTDGVDVAWEFDTGTWPPQYKPMPEGVAKTFVADAEYDDPLVAGEERDYTLDYAGELQVEGKKLLRVLVTRKRADSFWLFLDDETYLIVKRVEQRTTAGGRKAQVVTHYEDFRPIDGVLLAHSITVAIDGRVTQQTSITRIEANPQIKDVTFRRPRVAVPGLREP